MRRFWKRCWCGRAPARAPPFQSRCSTPWRTGWRCRCSSTRAATRRSASASRIRPSRLMARSRPEMAEMCSFLSRTTEWRVLAEHVLGDKALAADPNFATNVERVKRRAETDGRVAAAFATMDVDPLVEKLTRYDIAFGRINDANLLATHPHLRRVEVASPTGAVSMPAPSAIHGGKPRSYGAVPALGEHSESIRKEFSGK